MIIKDKNGRIQRRKVRSDGWTATMRAQFLDVLAVTCNMRAACAAVGKSKDSARDLRRRDGEFAILWAEAYEMGRVRLEEELIACALGQMPSGDNPGPERTEPPEIPFNPELAIKVLQLQRGGRASRARTAGISPRQVDVDAELLARIERLAARLNP